MKRWLSIAVLVVGCGKAADDGPPCSKVVDHMLDLMKSTAGGHGGMNLGSRDTMVAQCESRHMDKATRGCLVNSKDITGLANCSRMMPGGSAATPAPPPVAPNPAPEPPAAGSGTPPP